MARISRPTPENSQDVADQGGLRTSLTVIGFAVLLGLMTKAWLTSDLVRQRVRLASMKLHSDVVVDFGSARISLANGIFPELAIVVDQVKFASENVCWLAPLGEVDEVRLPVRFQDAIRGRFEIAEAQLGVVHLTLRRTPSECGANREPAQASPVNADVFSPLAAGSPKQVATGKTIHRVFVDQLHIQSVSIPSTTIDIDHLEIQRTGPGRNFHVLGHVDLGGITYTGDFSSRARFNINLEDERAQLDVEGSWREGKYRVTAIADQKGKTFEGNARIEHLPLSQIFSLLKKHNIKVGELDGRQVWLNLSLSTDGPQSYVRHQPRVKVDSVQLEGDLGTVDGGSILISKWSPLELTNATVDLRSFKLDKVATLLGFQGKPRTLGSLGEMNGVFRALGPSLYEVTGEFSGLEFIFSNRGERRVQTISWMNGVFRYDHGNWTFVLDRIRPSDGLLLGQMRFKGRSGDPRVEGKVRIEEMHLGPDVQHLLTGGGSLGRWAADLSLVLNENGLDEITGQVSARDLWVEGLEMERLRAIVHTAEGRHLIELQGREVVIHRKSRAWNFIEPLTKPWADREPLDGLRAPEVTVKFDFAPTGLLKWRLKQTPFSDLWVRGEGQADHRGRLSGSVIVRRLGEQHRWQLQGDRDRPVFGEAVEGGDDDISQVL